MALVETAWIFDYANLQSALLFMVVFALYSYLFRKSKTQETGLPPGPKGWPILGNLPSLSFHSEREMNEWNRAYGPVCRLKMGNMDFIILGSVEAVEEAFVKKSDLFSDRLQDSIAGIPGDGGILFKNYGHDLRSQRRFGLATLREFGMGRRSIEPRILEQCSELCEEVAALSDKREPFAVDFMIYQSISAVITQLVFHKNLPKENEDFRKYLHLMMTGNEYSPLLAITVFCPALKKIPPFKWGHEDSEKHTTFLHNLILEQISEHKKTRDPNEPRDFIDCYLNEMESDGNGNRTGFTDYELNLTVRDLFLAGSETTSSTICWILLYLGIEEDLQEQLHQEIEKVFGTSKHPSVSASEKMPFTKAVIQEGLRIRPVAPIGVPHVASREGTIMGYRIPEGAVVASNLFRLQHDENIWKNPDKFDPYRHLDKEGKFIKHPSVIPFSIGARHCLGQQLANMELFLVVCSLFQKFSFSVVDAEKIDLRGSNIFTLRPYPFKVIASRR